MILGIIILVMIHSCCALFEDCDNIYNIETDATLTIDSGNTLNAKNVSSCRYTITTSVNYIVEAHCLLQFDQPDSRKCPLKRYFVSVDGVYDLRGSDYFCSRNGTKRHFKRRSVMNRMVMAYAAHIHDGTESFVCKVRRVSVRCDCGWTKKTRIYNGEDAKLHEFPSMLILISLTMNLVFCSGVIISEKWGLTTAHCFNEPMYADLKKVAIYAGEHDLTTRNETIYTESYELLRIIRHELYSPYSYTQDNDIALLQPSKPFTLNRAVGPACLPWNFKLESFDNKYVDVTGFGQIYYGGPQATKLQKVSLQILEADKCEDSVKNKRKVCTYADKKDSCVSDSGSPLYYFKGRQFVIGLVSYGIGCGTKTPSVNTRINSYLDWILQNTDNESFCRK